MKYAILPQGMEAVTKIRYKDQGALSRLNHQGGHVCLHLPTNRVITHREVTPIPITPAVINSVNCIAKREGNAREARIAFEDAVAKPNPNPELVHTMLRQHLASTDFLAALDLVDQQAENGMNQAATSDPGYAGAEDARDNSAFVPASFERP